MTNKEKKTILITGGAGFIGSHLVEKYLHEGNRVIVVDNLQTTWKPRNIERFFSNPDFRFIKGDIIDLPPLLEHIDWIINCACCGSYTSYQFNPVHTVKTNTIGVINLLERAKKDRALFLQTSTSEIYGDPEVTPQPESYRGNVNTLGVRACYDEGKRIAETLCMDYRREYGVDARIIRIFNTYGPNMDPNDGRAITNFAMNALQNKNIIIYGDGTNTRSFQYIDDLVRGINAVLTAPDCPGPINLGNPGEITMNDLAREIVAATGSSSAIVHGEGATDDPRRRCPDIAKAKRLLGWEPRVPLTEGLAKTIAYFKTIDPPERKVLVFATTYYPDLGPAEEALYDLSAHMPDTEFHIITTKFASDRPATERIGTDTIHRVGWGSRLDKFTLPSLGLLRARRLAKENDYRFVWSIMGSYSGLAALFYKLLHRDANLLITLDDKELAGARGLLRSLLYRSVLGGSDTVFISDPKKAEGSELLKSVKRIALREGDAKAFLNKVRLAYNELRNSQEKKLDRPK